MGLLHSAMGGHKLIIESEGQREARFFKFLIKDWRTDIHIQVSPIWTLRKKGGTINLVKLPVIWFLYHFIYLQAFSSWYKWTKIFHGLVISHFTRASTTTCLDNPPPSWESFSQSKPIAWPLGIGVIRPLAQPKAIAAGPLAQPKAIAGPLAKPKAIARPFA